MKRTISLVLELEFEAEIRDIEDTDLQEHLSRFKNADEVKDDPYWHESLERQRRLLAQIVKHDEVVHQLLRESVLAALEEGSQRILEEILNYDRNYFDNAILALLKDMSLEDQNYFKNAQKEGFLYESTVLVAERFAADLLMGDVKISEEKE